MVREHSKADIIYFSGPETKEHEKKATKNEKSIISDTYRYIYAIYRYIYIFVRINCSFKNKKLKKQRKKKDTQRVKKTQRVKCWSGSGRITEADHFKLVCRLTVKSIPWIGSCDMF